MQNPRNCSHARILICGNNFHKLRKNEPSCGLSSLIHKLLKCFRIAYASNRTLLADPDHYRLNNRYLPLSNTCTLDDIALPENATNHIDQNNSRVIKLMPAEKIYLSKEL